MNVLNVPLYNALSTACPDGVVIVNEGCEGDLETVFENKCLRATRCHGGEEYKLNCPVCGDTRRRLYVSHWAFKNVRQKGKKVYTDGLFYCHNEKCDLREFKDTLAGLIDPADVEVPQVLRKKRAKKKEGIPLPEGSIPINAHDVPVSTRKYLEDRRFDPDELYARWGVMCCENLADYPEHGPKIIYPIHLFGKVVGWQARLSWDPSKEQQRQGIRKYYFPAGISKSDLVYNRDSARDKDVTVIVEGVTDVHRIGDAAVAIFGKVPSVRQTQIFKNVFGYNLGVMLLDADAYDDAQEYVEKYGKGIFAKGLFLVTLEEGDPASYTEEAIWNIITNQISRSLQCQSAPISK